MPDKSLQSALGVASTLLTSFGKPLELTEDTQR